MNTKNNKSVNNPHTVVVVIHEPTGYFTIYESRGTDRFDDDILRAAGLLKGENAAELEKNIKEFKKAIREGSPEVAHLWEEFGLIEGNVPQSITDNSGEPVQSDNRKRAETVSPNNNRTENLEKNQLASQEAQSAQKRVSQENPERENKSDAMDLETVVQTAALSTAYLAAFAIVGIFAASIMSAPALVAAAALWSAGNAANTFFKRANEAMAAGEEDYFQRATTAGISDLVPVVDFVEIAEVLTGINYMTGQEMTQQQRSEKIGALGVNAILSGKQVAAIVATGRFRKPPQDEKGVIKEKFNSGKNTVSVTKKTNSGRTVVVERDRLGYPDFSPYLRKGRDGKRSAVPIDYTGSRTADFKAANKAAGFKKTPEGYVWHHHQEVKITKKGKEVVAKGMMLLVEKDVHDAFKHPGGVKGYEMVFGKTYKD